MVICQSFYICYSLVLLCVLFSSLAKNNFVYFVLYASFTFSAIASGSKNISKSLVYTVQFTKSYKSEQTISL